MANEKMNNWTNWDAADEWDLDKELQADLDTPDINDPTGEELVSDADAIAAAKRVATKQAVKTGAVAVGSVVLGSLILANVFGLTKKKKHHHHHDDKKSEDTENPAKEELPTEVIDVDFQEVSDGSELDPEKIKIDPKAKDKSKELITQMADQMGIDPDDETFKNMVKTAWEVSSRFANEQAADDINALAKKAESQAKDLKADLNKKAEELAAQTKRADAQAKRAKEAEDEVVKLKDELKKLKAAEEARAAAEVKAAEIAADEEASVKKEAPKAEASANDEPKDAEVVKPKNAPAEDEIDEERAAQLAAKMRGKKGKKAKKNNNK